MRARKSWIALFAILVLLAACKGESPTAPPTGGGGPPGGTPPPSGATLTLVASNTEPVVDSSVVLTATATLDGQPVPNGTAVEFSATDGVFDGGTESTIIKTTTNGVATATLTNSDVGTVRVAATVNNVTRTVDITFKAQPTTPPTPSTAPVITSISPPVGRPSGGQTIRITGKNFRSPVKVLFDIGTPTPVEAFIVSSSETAIDVITPGVDLGAGQQLEADVIVITEAGSAAEQRVESTGGFIFRNEQLTPRISTATPNSGPVTGDTRVTIFGDGFQAPVQVLFGAAEARVVSVNFSEIIVMSPAARDTSDNGSGAVTGPVAITVRNINSQTSATMNDGFRYINAMQITAAGPTEGLFTGGTRVSIDGVGFVAPVAVSIGGVAALPVSVSGTKVIAITSGVDVTSCSDVTGPIAVTNVVNGDSATGPTFTYRVPKPAIVFVTDVNGLPLLPGEQIDVLVANAIPGVNRIKINDATAFVTSSTFNPDGTATFRATLPTNFEFDTEPCSVGGIQGERAVPLLADVTYLNVQTTCADTVEDAITITPPDTSCVLPPPPEVVLSDPPPPACADAGNVDDVDPAVGTASITFSNTGGQPLTVIRGPITGTNASDFTVSPSGLTINPGQSGTFTVTFNPAAVGPRSASVNFTTNDADEGSIDVCLQGNGT
jgi:hypothetical protein